MRVSKTGVENLGHCCILIASKGTVTTQLSSLKNSLFHHSNMLTHNPSIHGSTSCRPVRSSDIPKGYSRLAPNASSRASKSWAHRLQSFAVVVCRSKSKFESPSPNTANENFSVKSVSGCVLLLKKRKQTPA